MSKAIGTLKIGIDEAARRRKLLKETLSEWTESIFSLYEIAVRNNASFFNISESVFSTRIEFDGKGIPPEIIEDPFRIYGSEEELFNVSNAFQKTVAGIIGIGGAENMNVYTHWNGKHFAANLDAGKEAEDLAVKTIRPKKKETTLIYFSNDLSRGVLPEQRRPIYKAIKDQLYSPIPVKYNNVKDISVGFNFPHSSFQHRFSADGLEGILALENPAEKHRIDITNFGKKVSSTAVEVAPGVTLSGMAAFDDLEKDISGKVISGSFYKERMAIRGYVDEFLAELGKNFSDIGSMSKYKKPTKGDMAYEKQKKEIARIAGFSVLYSNMFGFQTEHISEKAIKALLSAPLFQDHTGKDAYSYEGLVKALLKNKGSKTARVYYTTEAFPFPKEGIPLVYIPELQAVRGEYDKSKELFHRSIKNIFSIISTGEQLLAEYLPFSGKEDVVMALIEKRFKEAKKKVEFINLTNSLAVEYSAYQFERQIRLSPILPYYDKNQFFKISFDYGRTRGELAIPVNKSANGLVTILNDGREVKKIKFSEILDLPFYGIVNNDELRLIDAMTDLVPGEKENENFMADLKKAAAELYVNAFLKVKSKPTYSTERSRDSEKTDFERMEAMIRDFIINSPESFRNSGEELITSFREFPIFKTTSEDKVSINKLAKDIEDSPKRDRGLLFYDSWVGKDETYETMSNRIVLMNEGTKIVQFCADMLGEMGYEVAPHDYTPRRRFEERKPEYYSFWRSPYNPGKNVSLDIDGSQYDLSMSISRDVERFGKNTVQFKHYNRKVSETTIELPVSGFEIVVESPDLPMIFDDEYSGAKIDSGNPEYSVLLEKISEEAVGYFNQLCSTYVGNPLINFFQLRTNNQNMTNFLIYNYTKMGKFSFFGGGSR
ncbi:TPA: hypothetical protein HA239_06100 [Candidatus Woesearchaeota archaeon]|nr:hypothetical protein QT06_C0001G1321 [archaeon GW2011_AR15]MBS3104221.1 hypothetical protein [Candidatus Woesearchaeota archaeon]HIH41948.1 hypothetical protein [Candidatus Woesearchaeota archaeon]